MCRFAQWFVQFLLHLMSFAFRFIHIHMHSHSRICTQTHAREWKKAAHQSEEKRCQIGNATVSSIFLHQMWCRIIFSAVELWNCLLSMSMFGVDNNTSTIGFESHGCGYQANRKKIATHRKQDTVSLSHREWQKERKKAEKST